MTPSGKQDESAYASALDLPSVRALLEQIRGMKLLTRVVGRKHRREVLEIEKQVLALAAQIDSFYDLLGDRNWIYHESLNTEVIDGLVKLEADEAENALIALYCDAEWRGFMIRQLFGLEQMRPRMELLERASEDYDAGRYYAVTLVLLTVMDGIVNDVETERRRGLHAREPDELQAWDSVVGHHLGLTRAHRTFLKSTFKTSTEPVIELFRNGIIHGTLVNYNNVLVATKAWNRLFAVGDWARSLDKPRETEAQPSWRELFTQLGQNAADKKALEEWEPFTLARTDPSFLTNDVVERATAYLEAWRNRNYGAMATMVPKLLANDRPSRTAQAVREIASDFALADFELVEARFDAPAVCHVAVNLTIAGEVVLGVMRWIKEDEEGRAVTPNRDGAWFLYTYGPPAMIDAAKSTPEPE